MPPDSRRRNRALVFVLLVLAALLAVFFLVRCRPRATADSAAAPEPGTPATAPTSAPPGAAPPATPLDEVLAPAVLTAPARVPAGARFSVSWTGPDNPGDYVTLVRRDAPDSAVAGYASTREGETLELTAPVEAGDWELRYAAGRSRTVLGRAPVTIMPVGAVLEAAPEVVLGGALAVTWTGPDNGGDYITLVPRETPDGRYGNYTLTREGSPLTVRAPVSAGEAELRYMTGQGNKVLGRRPVRIVVPVVSLSAPAEVVAGATVAVAWTGPDNPGDYVTLVARERPDGQYGNYTATSGGSPLQVLAPIEAGEAELRYMTGQGNTVLGRRPIRLLPVEATLAAPAEARAGAPVSIAWTGPNYSGDYITIVPAGTPDGEYRAYADTRSGSPASVAAPAAAGDAEIRYVTGQGGRVVGRRAIRVLP